MTRIASVLLKPISSAVLASLLTALIIAPETKVEIIERVYVRDPIKPKVVREVVVINRDSCPRDVILKAVNEVLRAQGRSGDGSQGNDVRTGAQGGGAGDVNQSGVAHSGDVVLGQVLTTIAICGRAEVTANNTVTDSEGRSGDAEVDNEAEIDKPQRTLRPRPTPRPKRTPPVSPSLTPAASPTTLPRQTP